jgi:hypothetical protein
MSSFIDEMSKFTRDASNSKFYDFEFVAVPGYADSWIVRYSHKPKNPFLKLLKKIHHRPGDFMIQVKVREGIVGFSADNGVGVENRSGPCIDFNDDMHDFFREIRDWFGIESN